MKIIYVLMMSSIIVLLIAIIFFFWAVNNEQYEDFDAPAKHIILDDKKDGNKNVCID